MANVFFSYARSDARAMAHRLKDAVIAAGHRAWIDVEKIDGGDDWAAAIEKAIDTCDATVALLSAGSYRSEICRAEQMRTLRKRKRLIPALVDSAADRPLFIEHLNYRDFTGSFDAALLQLLGDLNGDGEAQPPLPLRLAQTVVYTPKLEAIVPRPAQLKAIRDALLADESPRNVALTALRGMGGVGKTTLAIALCHDELVAAAFPDGIFWITVGRDPGDLAAKIADVGALLDDTARQRYATVDAAAARLTFLLSRRSVLLVLDDVWEVEHVRPLLLNLPQCRTLITTRDATIGAFLGARDVRIGSMEPEQSIELLRRWSGRDDPDLATIAERLGHLPLALRVAAANLRDIAPAEWLRGFHRVSQLRKSRGSSSRDENVEAAMDLSAERLSDGDRALFFSLGVFPEDVQVPLPAIRRYWRRLQPDLDDTDCDDLARHLARLELVEISGPDDARRIDMHDIVRLYVRGKLGTREPEMQRELLTAYNDGGRPWHAVDDDSYIHAMLLVHLDRAGLRSQGAAILNETTPEGRNGWYESRRHSGGLSGYLRDLRTVWRWSESEPGQASQLPLQLFCALCDCSVRSIATELPPAVVERLVEARIWDVGRAIEHVRQIADATDRAEVLRRIAVYAPPEQRRAMLLEALTALEETGERYLILDLRRDVLTQLCEDGFVGDAFERLMRSSGYAQTRSIQAIARWLRPEEHQNALLSLFPPSDGYAQLHVSLALLRGGWPPSAELLEYAVSAAEKTVGFTRGEAYSELYPLITDPERRRELVPQVMFAIRDMPGPEGSAKVLAKLVPALVDAGVSSEIESFIDGYLLFPAWRAMVEMPLIRLLPRAAAKRRLDALLAYTRSFEYGLDNIVDGLVIIAGVQPLEAREGLCREAIRTAARLDYEYARASALVETIDIMPGHLAGAVLEHASSFQDEEEKVRVIDAVVTRFPDHAVLLQAFDLAEALRRSERAADLMRLIAESAAGEERPGYVDRALAWCVTEDDIERASLEVKFLGLAAEPLKTRVAERCLGASSRAAYDHQRIDLLRALMAAAPESLHVELMNRAFAEDLPDRRNLLSQLAPRLDGRGLDRLLALSGFIGDEAEVLDAAARLECVAALPRNLPAAELVRIGCGLAKSIGDVETAAAVEIARSLASRGAIDDAASVAAALGNEGRVQACRTILTNIAPRLGAQGITEIISGFGSVRNEEVRFLLSAPLLAFADPAVLRRAVETWRGNIGMMAFLIPLLPAEERSEHLPAAIDRHDLYDFFLGYEALAAILPYLEQSVIEDGWQRMNRQPLEDDDREVLMLLSARLGQREVEHALDAAGRLDKPQRAEILARASRCFADPETRRHVLSGAVSAAEALGEGGSIQASAYVACALASDPEQRDDFIVRASLSAAQYGLPDERRRLLFAFGPLLWRNQVAPIDTLQHIVSICAARTRAEFLGDVAALSYTLHFLGGPEAAGDIAHSVRQVGSWWR